MIILQKVASYLSEINGSPTEKADFTSTMLTIGTLLSDFESYALNLKSDLATLDILKIVNAERNVIDTINSFAVEHKYEDVLKTVFSHALPRGDNFFFRKNYDYGQAWPQVLENFKKRKIRNVVDMAKKLRRWKGDSHKDNVNHSVDPDKDIAKKKIMQRAFQESLLYLDSYCGKEENIEYWNQLREEDEYNEAVEDFIDYATKEIECLNE